MARLGKLDILVPNAGIWDYHRNVTRIDGKRFSEAFDEVFGINVKSYVLAVEAAWPELVATRGSIVMTFSNASFPTDRGGSLHTAGKQRLPRRDFTGPYALLAARPPAAPSQEPSSPPTVTSPCAASAPPGVGP